MDLFSSLPKLDVDSNPTRKIQCVNAMAEFLSRALTLKDPEMSRSVSWKESDAYKLNRAQLSKAQRDYWRREEMSRNRCIPFGMLLHSEFAVKATREQEERLKTIFELDRFARVTTSICSSMIEESDEKYEGDFFESQEQVAKVFDASTLSQFQTEENRQNVDLWFYAYSMQKSPFFVKYDYTTSNGFKIPVGGVSKSLCDEFERLVNDWLHRCDKMFCKVHDLSCTREEAMDEHVRNLSKAIARRHSLMIHPKDKVMPHHVDSVLDTDALERMAVQACFDGSFATYDERALDIQALNALLVIAKNGGTAYESQNVILKQTSALYRALEKPPQELGLHLEKRVKKFNFAALRKILSVGMDNPFLFRCECAQTWYENHGEWSAVEIQNALNYINRLDVKYGTGYLEVAGTQFKRGSTELPPNPCAFEEAEWYAYAPDFRKRSNLSQLGMRIVCMNTLMRKRVEANSMKFGTCNKQILHNIATDHMRKASYATFMLETDRMRNNQGVGLLLFERDINSSASELSEKLDSPLCALSGVSYAEIDFLFGQRENFNKVRMQLSAATRALLPKNVVPEEYSRCTDDALSIVLCSIKQRRESHGIQLFTRPARFADMLRCVPKIRGCIGTESMRDSFLSLSIQEIASSHPELRPLLDMEATRAKRTSRSPWMWMESKGHNKVYFVFDIATLLQKLQLSSNEPSNE